MVYRLVANVFVLILVLCVPQGVRAAACSLPVNPISVQYDVYSELDRYPGDVLADDLITTHMQRAQDVFLPDLKLIMTDGTRPDVGKLTHAQGDMVRALLAGTGGDGLEEVLDQFKQAAESDGFYNPKILNVYYIDLVPITGMHFNKRDGQSHNIIVVGLGFLDETLAHEFGHAFSLDHANFWSHDDPDLCRNSDQPCGIDGHDNRKIFPNGVQVEYCAEYAYHDNKCEFTRKNVMWAKSEARTEVTKNQAERAACNNTSTLISNGDHSPPGDATDCPDWTEEGDCKEVY